MKKMFVISIIVTIIVGTSLMVYGLSVETEKSKIEEEIYPSCGYKGCPEISKNKTNVHLICHTHDDVGWVKTADEYFFGGNRRQNYFAVEQILDSVVSELLKNKERRFVYVESAFLWRWWLIKEDLVKDALKKLVDEGRLQLLGGGWVMSDEATPHYSALIDQMTVGHRFLKDTFGECNLPKVAWQIDPFGHSSEVAIEFAEMGFDGLFFSRMDKREYDNRRMNLSLEMIWKPDTREGPDAEIFTGQTYDPMHPYHPPNGLCFDITCKDEPVIDNKIFHGYNIERRARDFISTAKSWASVYRTNNVMLTMGGDFHYLVASSWFNNLDRLIKYINENSEDMNVIYSTPACYLKALHSTKIDWPTKKNEDFFPYGGTYSEIWTGYYTSRPNFKYIVYRANNFLQVCKQLRVPLGNMFQSEQDSLARAVAMAQHHDAVSGTEKEYVAEDYKRYLFEGISSCEKIINTTISSWQEEKLSYKFCHKLNITQCEITEKNTNFIITVYNPHAHIKNYVVNIPVNLDSYVVHDSEGKEKSFDLLPVPDEVKLIPGRVNYANYPHEMIFKADGIPPLGIKSFFVKRIEPEESYNIKSVADVEYFKLENHKEDNVVKCGIFELLFNSETGLLNKVIRDNEVWKFGQNFFFYEAEYSGAYLFSASSEAKPITYRVMSISVAKGEHVVEVRQTFTDFISQIIRLYADKDQIEFQWLVGPLPRPMQVITRYSTAIEQGSSFYTDSNGRRLMKRIRHDSIEKSYYPITSAAVLRNDTHRFTVLTDRPQGAASWAPGSIEVMIHRKLWQDDNKGVEEVLDEREFALGLATRGKHIVQLSKSSQRIAHDNGPVFADGAKRHRIVAQDIVMEPVMAFSKALNMDTERFKKLTPNLEETPILKNLPENVHLLTLERWTDTSVLLRLEHIFEIDEEPKLSKPATVNLKELFTGHEVTAAVELSLAGTLEKTKMKRLKWMSDSKLQEDVKVEPLPSSLQVTLKPMQIRTFEIFLSPAVEASLRCLSCSSASTKLDAFVGIIVLNFIAHFLR